MSNLSVPRKIRTTWKSRPAIEGAGVHLKRALGNGQEVNLDPFLLLDDFRAERPEMYLPGFPWHPHRGMETITYILDGEVEHGDSLGHGGVIRPGDVQWMTAGNGIIHQEMPKGDAKGRMGGFQLWANLPRSSKMIEPRYRGVPDAEIPRVTTASGATVRVICGNVEGVQGPVRDIVTDPEYLDVSLPAVASGSWGGRCLSTGDYVMGAGPTDGATPPPEGGNVGYPPYTCGCGLSQTGGSSPGNGRCFGGPPSP